MMIFAQSCYITVSNYSSVYALGADKDDQEEPHGGGYASLHSVFA